MAKLIQAKGRLQYLKQPLFTPVLSRKVFRTHITRLEADGTDIIRNTHNDLSSEVVFNFISGLAIRSNLGRELLHCYTDTTVY